jgi:hypothetical protein
MKLAFGVLAGLVFVSTVAVGQHAHDDFYNRGIESQVDQYRAENSAIGQAPTALAGNNMRTDGQQLAKDTFSQSSGNDFYNGVLAAQVEGYIEDKNLVAPAPTLLAGNNMITGEQPQLGPVPEDFYNRVLAAKLDEYIADNNAIAPSATKFAELQPMSEVPSSMASNDEALSERDWYDRVVATQAELNRRIKQSELSSF